MERIVNIAGNFKEADAHDRRQALELTAAERIKIARKLQRRVFGSDCPDIREWHRNRKS